MKHSKYQRTYHHPLSMAVTSDDKRHSNDDCLKGREVWISEKRDGECTSMYNDHIHARSLDSKDHVSRHWVKQLWSSIKLDIPDNMKICGENIYAKHSVFYDDLVSYFEVFNIWENDVCLSLEDTISYSNMLGLKMVPTIYEGPYDIGIIKDLIDNMDTKRMEGFVIRSVDSFSVKDFSSNVMKVVREGHVQTKNHWMHEAVTKNELRT